MAQDIKETNESGQAPDRFLTIPNLISIVRIVMVIPILYFLKQNTPESNLTAFILIGSAYITDFLDGFIARIARQESRIGQILDPVGDKLLAVTVSAVLFIQSTLPFAFFIIILLRDIILTIGAMYGINLKKIVLPPLIWGKIATFFLGLILSLYPLTVSTLKDNAAIYPVLKMVVLYGTWLVAGLLILSLLIYAAHYSKNLLDVRKRTDKPE